MYLATTSICQSSLYTFQLSDDFRLGSNYKKTPPSTDGRCFVLYTANFDRASWAFRAACYFSKLAVLKNFYESIAALLQYFFFLHAAEHTVDAFSSRSGKLGEVAVRQLDIYKNMVAVHNAKAVAKPDKC